ncbi:MAG: hypothetical protein WC669_01820 [Patescibacteria group bacterium]|jgi:hypothetical protein
MKNLTIALFLVLSLLINISLANADVWQAPPANPPNGNTSMPVDVSASNQTKAGSINVTGGLSVGPADPAAKFFTVASNGALTLQATASFNSLATFTTGVDVTNAGTAVAVYGHGAGDGVFGLTTAGAIGGYAAVHGQAINGAWAGYFVGPFGVTGNTGLTGNLNISGVITIAGGTPAAGQVLTSDANGLASWEPPAGGSTPGGADTQVQFNNAGSFSGDAGLTFYRNWNNTNTTLLNISAPNPYSGEVRINRSPDTVSEGLSLYTVENISWFAGIPYNSGNSESGFSIGQSKNKSSAQIYIDPGVGVGIGKDNPSVKLDINGMVMAGSVVNVTAGQNLFYGNMTNASVGNLLLLQRNSTDKFKVDREGNVTLGADQFGQQSYIKGFYVPSDYDGSNGCTDGQVLKLFDDGNNIFSWICAADDNGGLANNAVTNPKMADNAIGSVEIIDGSIMSADINGSAGITGAQLASDLSIGGHILLPAANTPTTPAYSFTGDTNTGIYSSADGNINFAVNNVLRSTINSTYILSVGDIIAQGSDFYDDSGDVHLNGEDNVYIKMDYNNNDADTRNIIFGKNTALGTAPAGANELMRLTETGNLGINTVGPDRKLDVLDASNPQLRLTQADGTVYSDFQMDSNGDLLINVDGASNQLILDNGGNVGIGAVSPAEKFEVRDDTGGTARIRIADTAQNPELQLKYGAGATEHWGMYVNQADDVLKFWRGADVLSINSNGDATTTGNLTVGGNEIKNSTGVSSIQFENGNVIIRLGQ